MKRMMNTKKRKSRKRMKHTHIQHFLILARMKANLGEEVEECWRAGTFCWPFLVFLHLVDPLDDNGRD